MSRESKPQGYSWNDLALRIFTTFLGVYDIYRRRAAPCFLSSSINLLRTMLGIDITEDIFAILSDICSEIIFLESKERYLQRFANPLTIQAECGEIDDTAFIITISTPITQSNKKRQRITVKNKNFDRDVIQTTLT